MSKTSNFFAKRTAVSAAERNEHVPWVEKYRPKTVDDVAHQEEVVRTLKKSIESANLPHLLFYGPPGTGKTSTILAIGRDLYGTELLKERVLELNASDERGIDIVRHKIKNFSQVATSAKVQGGKSVPGYKLVILDEADAMTGDAQTALRRTMETYSKSTRFCLICNYISRIIEPLASRCAKFRFKPLGEDTMRDRIKMICESEKVVFNDDIMSALALVSDGDMRKAITYLQSAHRLYGENLNSDSIIEIAGVIPPTVLKQLLVSCRSNSFDDLQAAVQHVFSQGYPASQIMSQLHEYLIATDELNNEQKAKIALKLGVADKCMVDGADEFLQLMDVCATVMYCLCVSG
eukprot:TRINITY_DN2160_c0_g1_i1.p1 TRINITY_DN2160_c0_g1~~TRINITY_DN2160_c0_g1_i1.p1  ORF type:complete len:349 (-),score=97.09 TRINITY_DN2160_c0_g1_i1:22-1068(-)